MSSPTFAQTDPPSTEDTTDDSAEREVEGLNMAALVWDSKWLMLPIFLASLLVGAASIERTICLRKRVVIPGGLVFQLGRLGSEGASFDPRAAYKICQQYPSAAANVLRGLLEKVGRPQSEVQAAVMEISNREAERLYVNVRWLTLAAAVTPLMGLLGTVWGMIRAFHDTTQLAPGQNKADYLASGIYTALVTTLGGLVVAIPSAILAHYFEGKIQSLFHQIHELAEQLLPQVERFEGRVRFARREASSGTELLPDRTNEPVAVKSEAG
jgi:biopolymer transport protein ExbB